MTRTFCTIATKSHLFKVFALNQSLRENGSATLHTLVVDTEDASQIKKQPGIVYHTLNGLANQPLVWQLRNSYSNQDYLRWCAKPLLLLHLLETEEKVIYLDSDLYFYNSYEFLFGHLDSDNILLTPHWRSADPEHEQIALITYLREGVYNAGFLGVNQSAKGTLEWWAKACLYRCERNYGFGLFVDQKYLDIFPALEPRTRILHHKGCNVSGWNIDACARVQTGDGVLIDNNYPVVFIHFANETLYRLRKGQDPLLVPYFERYLASLHQFNPGCDPLAEASSPAVREWFRYFRWRLFELLSR